MLKELVEKYARKVSRLKLVMLFGSRARGDFTDSSDIDILIVADDLPVDPREAYLLLYDYDFPNVNPLGMNTEAFLKKLSNGSTFIMEIVEDGKPLYVDEEFMRSIQRIYCDVRRKWVRKGRLWVKKELSVN
ncbi:MAG: nucleotidyltransferase domain-containing protein [Desulfurococcaceae archaeon]